METTSFRCMLTKWNQHLLVQYGVRELANEPLFLSVKIRFLGELLKESHH